jgi:hypothetical protein
MRDDSNEQSFRDRLRLGCYLPAARDHARQCLRAEINRRTPLRAVESEPAERRPDASFGDSDPMLPADDRSSRPATLAERAQVLGFILCFVAILAGLWASAIWE